MSKCPKCGAFITHVNLQGIEVHVDGQSRWHGSSYCCPLCQSVLSVSIDPIALKNDVIDVIKSEVKKLLLR